MENYKRVKYNKCPLSEVVLQINFPSILSIDVDEPSSFQSKIREQFPFYNSSVEGQGQLSLSFEYEEVNPILQNKSSKKVHYFLSSDKKWKISFSKNHFAISTLQYESWEDMISKFDGPFSNFCDIYNPGFFERIGARYVDLFSKEKLNLKDSKWSELLSENILGSLSSKVDYASKIISNYLQSEIEVNGVHIVFEAGLATNRSSPREELFMLNCDYFNIGSFTKDNLKQIMNKLHEVSQLFFRKNITEKLHNAMEPVKFDDEE